MKSIFKRFLLTFMIILLQVFGGLFAYAQDYDRVICISVTRMDIKKRVQEKWIADHSGCLVSFNTDIECGALNIPAMLRYIYKPICVNPADQCVCELFIVYDFSVVKKLYGDTLPARKRCKLRVDTGEDLQIEFCADCNFSYNHSEDISRRGIVCYSPNLGISPVPLDEERLLSPTSPFFG